MPPDTGDASCNSDSGPLDPGAVLGLTIKLGYEVRDAVGNVELVGVAVASCLMDLLDGVDSVGIVLGGIEIIISTGNMLGGLGLRSSFRGLGLGES